MSGYPIIFGEGVDPDAYQYFLRAGIASGTQTPTSYDNAASFNGTNQFLSIPSNSTLQLGGTDFTLSGWVNLTSLQASDRLIFAKSNSTGGDYSFAISSSGQLKFARFNGSWATPNTTSTIPLNQWVHCVVTVSSLSLTFYINGNLSATAGGAYTLPSGIANQTNSDFSIGQYGNVTGNGLWLGSIGPCAIWKRALSASEVTALFNNGAGRTYASLDTGLRTNLISWWALNGNSSAVSLTDSHGTNTLTNNGTVTAPNIGPIVTTTQNSRQLINNFVKGIKSLGLWNSMVCWPLRSSQNAGGGTTAFSLGGLGRFDGTLVNAPTWGSDGINCATTSQRLSFGPAVNIQSYGGFTIFGTQIHRNLSSSFDLSLWTRDDSFWPESTFQSVSQSVARIRISTSPSRHVTAERVGTEQNSFHSYHATVDSNESGFLTYNKTSPVAFGAPSTTGLPPTIDWTLARTASGVYAMHGVMRRYTQGQQAQLYDLYRQTLGLGLGLP
jgi:hypothetical protein